MQCHFEMMSQKWIAFVVPHRDKTNKMSNAGKRHSSDCSVCFLCARDPLLLNVNREESD